MFRSAITTVLLAVALAPATLADIFPTAPVAQTTCAAGSACTISWKDDGTVPSLAQFGPASVGVFAGSQQQQTLLQSITDNVNVGTTASIVFTPSASIGPNGAEYFIKFVSLGTKDTTTGFPAEAFTAKFTLSGMTGTFNASVQSEIAAATGATSSPTSGSSTATTTTSKSSSSSSGSKTGSSTATSSTTSASSSAERIVAGSAVGVVSIGAILLGLL